MVAPSTLSRIRAFLHISHRQVKPLPESQEKPATQSDSFVHGRKAHAGFINERVHSGEPKAGQAVASKTTVEQEAAALPVLSPEQLTFQKIMQHAPQHPSGLRGHALSRDILERQISLSASPPSQ